MAGKNFSNRGILAVGKVDSPQTVLYALLPSEFWTVTGFKPKGFNDLSSFRNAKN